MFGAADPYNLNCPSREVLDLIGGKWAILILCCLQQGPVRTGVLMRSIGGISPKMLTQTLRELERNGMIERVSYPEVPPRVDYRLTALGASLSQLARAMEQWVVANYPAILTSRAARAPHVRGDPAQAGPEMPAPAGAPKPSAPESRKPSRA